MTCLEKVVIITILHFKKGGESVSTGIEKLRLHTEVPSCS